MKRILATAVVLVAFMAFAVARPVAASNRYWATGADVKIDMIAHCGEDFTYPANTAFFISHGWLEQPWADDAPENKQGFMGPATYFEFRIDRGAQASTMFVRNFPGSDLQLKLFISEFDQGLTGSHRFGAVWFIDGGLVGEAPGVSVFAGACVSQVTFT